MICFPNAKINIGLEVLRKRADNFHDLETIFYPVSLCDILEMNTSDKTTITITGIDIIDDPEKNLVLKAYRLLNEEFSLPPVEFHLHKQIPTGAGLGGGSADAAFTLMGLNELFHLSIGKNKLLDYASLLGSDCAFFVLNYPVFAEGKGNLFSEIALDLKGLSLVLIKPDFSVSTAQAYCGIQPALAAFDLKDSIMKPVKDWKNCIHNRFEDPVFTLYPQLLKLKESLYSNGALYASMSGSGSSVFGLFEEVPPTLQALHSGCFYWEEKLNI